MSINPYVNKRKVYDKSYADAHQGTNETSIYLRKEKYYGENITYSIVYVEIDGAGHRYDKVNFAFGSRDYRICGQSVLPRIALNLRNTKPTFPLNRYVSLPDKGETNRLRLRQEQWRIKRTLKPNKKKRYSSLIVSYQNSKQIIDFSNYKNQSCKTLHEIQMIILYRRSVRL